MKTEKEKMLAGEFYDASDQELRKEAKYAKEKMHQFNTMRPGKMEEGIALLSQLMNLQDSTHIEAPLFFDYGYNITIGKNFYANHGLCILDVCEVSIGDNVLMGPYVQIYTASHPLDPITRLSGKENGKSITIGNNVWLGGGSIICPGVTIGDNVSIGAGSVVTKDIPGNVVAAGNPCKIIRKV